MKFYKFWQRHNAKASFSREPLSFDLSFQLSYMASVAAAGVPRAKIFELAGELPSSCSKYFKTVNIMCQKLGYDYPEACRMVGQSAKEWEIKSLLLRIADALNAGESETEFYAREAELHVEVYGNDYARNLESLSKWTDAYESLIVSVTLIVLVAVVSMMIYSVSTTFLFGLLVTMVLVSCGGVYLIYTVVPKEVKTHSASMGSPSQLLSRRLFKFLLPVSVVGSAGLLATGADSGWILVMAGAMLFPVGMVAVYGEREMDRQDQEIATFLRALGNVASGAGATVTDAVSRLDLRATASLSGQIHRLRSRLKTQIDPDICWQRFVTETGSELVSRSVGMFHDAVHMGAEPEDAGGRSSMLALKVSLMRAKRKLISGTFMWLSFAMHAVSVGLFVFIVNIVDQFGTMIHGAQEELLEAENSSSLPLGNMFSFSFGNAQVLWMIIIPVILVLTVTNALAPYLTEGGDKYKIPFYLGITSVISGVLIMAVPRIASGFFVSASG